LKGLEYERLNLVPEIKYNTIKVNNKDNNNPVANVKTKDCAQKKIKVFNAQIVNKVVNKVEIAKKSNNKESGENKVQEKPMEESKKVILKEKIEGKTIFQAPIVQELVELSSDKKDEDSVLMASQESPVNMVQSKSPRIFCAEKSPCKYKRRFVAKRSPFSEIVDEGISEYLGNNSYISNKNKSSKS
jgi:hypothetical protein